MPNKRQALIEQLEWNSGGYGFGICSVATSMMWAMDEPTKNKPDLKSIVGVCGDPTKYTTEELIRIVQFSTAATEHYDEMFRYRRGCNMILLDKRETGSWMRKRLTWTQGPMYSPSLEEACAIFEKDWEKNETSKKR